VTENLANYSVIFWVKLEKEQLCVDNVEFFDFQEDDSKVKAVIVEDVFRD
jgi:hypothetical protein